MAPLIPLLLPLIPGIIQGVEGILKSKKGPEKKDIAVEMASAVLKKLRENGTFDGPEGAKEVADLVQTVFDVMKSTGTLKEEKEGAVSPGQRVVFEGTLRTL